MLHDFVGIPLPHMCTTIWISLQKLLEDRSPAWILLDKEYVMKRWLSLESDPRTARRGHFYKCFLPLPHERKNSARFSPAPGACEGVNIDPRKILVF